MGTLCDRSTALIDSGAISFVVTSGQETLLHMLSEPGIYCAPTVAEQALEATVFPRAPLPQLIRALLELVQAIAAAAATEAGAACLPDVQEHLLPRAGMQTVWGKPACCASARWSC